MTRSFPTLDGYRRTRSDLSPSVYYTNQNVPSLFPNHHAAFPAVVFKRTRRRSYGENVTCSGSENGGCCGVPVADLHG